MPIVCPHCTTSYAVDPATLGSAGRNVRCARCKEIWLAHPADAVLADASAMAFEGQNTTDDGAGWDDPAQADAGIEGTPHVESPPIAGEWSEPVHSDDAAGDATTDSTLSIQQDNATEAREPKPSLWRRLKIPSPVLAMPLRPRVGLSTICVGMAALAVALIVWRGDVVRLLPQTATFFKLAGFGVNLRGLAFEDVKIATELVDGKPVLVIEGAIVDITRRPVEIPRLRFVVRDAQGADIYAWNAVLEQSVLKPGEKAWFRSRLASPPAEGREIAVRFFHKRDIAAGGA